jgi:hypothetical protein
VPTFRIHRWRGFVACACALIFAAYSNASVIVQLKVVEGEGAEYHTGSRATRGLTVLVTDEAGKPVQDAAVSFRLPDSGATGVFNSGLRTEIVKTGPNGRAVVWGMRWSDTPGTVDVHITAIKDQARAGIVTSVRLTDAPAPPPAPALAAGSTSGIGGEGVFKRSHKGFSKWLWIAAAAGGAAVAGMAFGGSKGGAAPAASTMPATITIGAPSITVGHP